MGWEPMKTVLNKSWVFMSKLIPTESQFYAIWFFFRGRRMGFGEGVEELSHHVIMIKTTSQLNQFNQNWRTP